MTTSAAGAKEAGTELGYHCDSEEDQFESYSELVAALAALEAVSALEVGIAAINSFAAGLGFYYLPNYFHFL